MLINNVEVQGSQNFDRVIKRKDNIYLNVDDSGNFYKFEFQEEKLALSLLGNTGRAVLSLVEHGNAVYVGSSACKLFKIENQTAKEILKTRGIPTDIQIKGIN